jgi:hypothetical protein
MGAEHGGQREECLRAGGFQRHADARRTDQTGREGPAASWTLLTWIALMLSATRDVRVQSDGSSPHEANTRRSRKPAGSRPRATCRRSSTKPGETQQLRCREQSPTGRTHQSIGETDTEKCIHCPGRQP